MSEEVGSKYLKRYSAEIIYHQAKSEGISATFIDTQQIIEGRTDSSIVTYSEKKLIIALKKAWEYILDNLGVDFHIENLCLLNAIVSDDTNTKPGIIRNDNTYIIEENGKRYYPLPVDRYQIKESILSLNKILDPFERAIETFLYFSKTCIFENCNKRGSFLMSNKVLIENGFGIIFPPLDTKLDKKYKVDSVNYYLGVDVKSIKKTLLSCCYNCTEVDNYKYENQTEFIFLKDYKKIDSKIYNYIENNNLIWFYDIDVRIEN